MKRILFIAFMTFLIPSMAYSDCRGCCNGHGGIVCVNGITKCVDGTDLSDRCREKDCNICPGDTVTTNDIETDLVKIASFNIQVFVRTKASKPEVMEILAKIISRFDTVAVQEIRDKSGKAVKALEMAVDTLGINYDFIIGPRLGRTRSKEQYAYFYRVDSVHPGESYTYQEKKGDSIHREPFISKFTHKSS